MSKIAAVLYAFLFPFGAALPQQDINRLLDSVVSISVASNIPNAPGHFGTGFIISATGGDILVVTARHVLFSKEGDPIFDTKGLLVTFRADRYNPKPASWLVNGPAHLLFSVLKVSKKDAGELPSFPTFELRTRPIDFEDVRVMTGEWTAPKMSVSSTVLNTRLDQFSYNGFGIAGGDSGSPVIDLNGQLVGMHQGEVDGTKDGWAQRMQEVVATLTGPTMGLKTEIGGATPVTVPEARPEPVFLPGGEARRKLAGFAQVKNIQINTPTLTSASELNVRTGRDGNGQIRSLFESPGITVISFDTLPITEKDDKDADRAAGPCWRHQSDTRNKRGAQG